jgi:uroporphyrinogen III methyltransferase/synthase
MVYLIGAGPGNPKLITVRGLECLRKAEVVVYDRLGTSQLLREVRPGAELIYVGKASGNHAMRQEEINLLLARKAEEGKVVARLKGGDPFVFGRGGEEAEVLAGRGIPFEVVPGISSSISAPAYAGIPVTHRSCASSFAVVTGHEDPTKEQSSIDWAKIATGTGTVVFLMGLSNLGGIVRRLTGHGRPPGTPIALIQWGSLMEQRTVTGTLATIEEVVREAGLESPVVIVVGEVVSLREKLRWFETRPLFGRRIALFREWDRAGNLAEAIEHLGGEVIEIPVIHGEEPADWRGADRTLIRLRECPGVVFTSPAGVERFFSRLDAAGLDIRALAGPRVNALGAWTAEALRSRGIRPDHVDGRRVFLKEVLADAAISAVAFAGTGAMTGWAELFSDELLPLTEGAAVVCLDRETAGMAAAEGLDVDLVLEEPTAAALAEGLASGRQQNAAKTLTLAGA